MGEVQLANEGSSRNNELDQSRKIFIDLLRDKSTLSELGYTQKQIDYASPIVALLLHGQGKETLSPHPTTDFTNPSIYKATARIERFLGGQGFLLSAKRKLPNPHDFEAVRKAIEKDRVFPVPSWMAEVIRIGLFEQNANIDDLNFLVPQLITNWIFVSPPLGMKPKSPATQLTQLVGLNSTFEVAWVDPRVKSEFVVELDSPRLMTRPEKVAFKRLSPISGPNGTYIPFGMKAELAAQKTPQSSAHL